MLTQIKLILVAILVVALSVSVAVGMWYRMQVKEEQIKALKVEAEVYKARENAYQKNMTDIKEQRKKDQIVIARQNQLLNSVGTMNTTKCIGEEDEKIFSDITRYFNHADKLYKTGDTATAEVLPSARASNASGWTIKMIANNYLMLIGYSLQQENCIECFME